jgi:hypothetical protein
MYFSLVLISICAAIATPKEFIVKDIKYGGSGCSAGTVWGTAKPFPVDINFRALKTTLNNDDKPETRKCQIEIDIEYPEKQYSYAMSIANLGGIVDVPDGMVAIQRTVYFFRNSRQRATTTTKYIGKTREQVTSEALPEEKLAWSRCNIKEKLYIDIELQIIKSPTFQKHIEKLGRISIHNLHFGLETLKLKPCTL